MHQAKYGGMKRCALGATAIGQRLAVQWPVVNALATQRPPPFAPMDPHLAWPPRLQATFDQRERTQWFDDTNICHRPRPLLPFSLSPCLPVSLSGRPPPPIATIATKPRLDPPI